MVSYNWFMIAVMLVAIPIVWMGLGYGVNQLTPIIDTYIERGEISQQTYDTIVAAMAFFQYVPSFALAGYAGYSILMATNKKNTGG